VRLIDENGAQVGIVSVRDALIMAEERGLDLVEVAPNAVPPVCRILDYGKFRYEQSKKEREARKNQKQVEVKQIRLEPKTDDHDIDVKAKQARRFLVDGDKVKFNLRFRGREIYHAEIGREMLEQMAETLRDISIVEQRPLMEGRVLSLTLAPNAKAKQLQQQRAKQLQQQRVQSTATSNSPADKASLTSEELDDDIDDVEDDDIDDIDDAEDDDIDDIDDAEDDDIDDIDDANNDDVKEQKD
jgi:translation initiation factor IF-3